ncbi:MAG: SRPBCC family protein [Candidatus Nanopelagicales bacterium]|nr:SRPBCC family protein [Candidatus Nanopelagicales bacterium]
MTAHLVESITIAKPALTVFDTVHDYRIRTQWDTLLRRAYTVGGARPARDVVTTCVAHWYLGGLAFTTRYVTFNRPNLAAVTLVTPYFIFQNWSASIRHRDRPIAGSAAPSSELVYTLTLRCRPAALARPLEFVAIRLFRTETRRRLRALKRYLEAS